MLKWLKTFSISAMHSLNFLCKIAPMAEFICASFLIFEILDISTIFTKDKHVEDKNLETENMYLFLL